MATTYANMCNFSHKGSGDKSICTVPDVCKTPVGPAVVPLPYPAISQVGDLDAGSSTVKIEGKPTSLKGSNHKSCTGGQPGVQKGLISSTGGKTTEFITFSFDVKCDGEGVARGFDMTTMNDKNTMGTVLGSMTGPAMINDEEPEEWEPEETPPWIKIQANYNDLWNTPFPAENVNVKVNGTVVAEKVSLNEGLGQNTRSYSIAEAKASKKEAGVLVIEPEEHGKVEIEIVAEPGIEDEIKKAKEAIEAQLDGAYRATVESMAEFQELWDTYGYASIAISGAEGAYQGAANWLGDQAELFEAETWKKLGTDIADITSTAFDYASDYAKETGDKILKTANELSDWTDENEDNLTNWNWWQTQINEAIGAVGSEVDEQIDYAQERIDNAIDFLGESKEKLDKLIKHKDEIAKLPEYIASGDAVKVQLFVDTVLKDIDPELADEIKNSAEFPLVLELINDHEAALVYVTYMQLFMEAVPPNFYAYISGKAGAYVGIELLLLIGVSFLTAGAGTAARLTALAARISASSAKVAKVGQKIKKAKAAIDALVETIEDFVDVIGKLKELGTKLKKGRSAGLVKSGRSKGTLKMTKDNKKRDKRCKNCHKSDHPTPRSLHGKVEYV